MPSTSHLQAPLVALLTLIACGEAAVPHHLLEPPPQTAALSPRHQACGGGRVAERRLGLVTGLLEEDSAVLREHALLAGVRSSGVLVAFDRGLALGGFGELITIAQSGAWQRVVLGAEDVVADILPADLDNDSDDDLLVLVERAVVFTEGVERVSTSMPFAHFLSQERGQEQAPSHFELRSTTALQTDGVSDAPLRIADVTGDGKPDLAAIEVSQPIVYRGDGALRFVRQVAGPVFPNAHINARCRALLGYDRDGDHDTDLVALCADGDLTNPFSQVFDNAGDGRFTLGPTTLTFDSTSDEPASLKARAFGEGGATPGTSWPLGAARAHAIVSGPGVDAPATGISLGFTHETTAIAVRDGAANAPTRVHILLDLGCSASCMPQCKRCFFERCAFEQE